jgi:hypothetical protein
LQLNAPEKVESLPPGAQQHLEAHDFVLAEGLQCAALRQLLHQGHRHPFHAHD